MEQQGLEGRPNNYGWSSKNGYTNCWCSNQNL